MVANELDQILIDSVSEALDCGSALVSRWRDGELRHPDGTRDGAYDRGELPGRGARRVVGNAARRGGLRVAEHALRIGAEPVGKESGLALSSPVVQPPGIGQPADATVCRTFELDEGPVVVWLRLEGKS
jgi:hypothetical protein